MTDDTLRAALDLIAEMAPAYHATESVRNHSDPTDKTGWHVKGIETCADALCVEAVRLSALAASATDEPDRTITPERLAVAMNTAQLDPSEIRLGRDLTVPARRILAALAASATDEGPRPWHDGMTPHRRPDGSLCYDRPPEWVARPAVPALDDHIAWAQHVRSEHEATHGEAEQCGAECVVLGLAEFDAASATDDPGLADIAGHSCSQCRRVASRPAVPALDEGPDEDDLLPEELVRMSDAERAALAAPATDVARPAIPALDVSELRVSSDEIDLALISLGPPGTRAEAIVFAAAKAASAALSPKEPTPQDTAQLDWRDSR